MNIEDSVLEQSRDLETRAIALIEQSENRAWKVARISWFVTILLTITLALLIPLKKVVPFLLRVDTSSGVPEVVTALDVDQISADEALDKHFVSMYIKNREGYYFHSLQKEYELTQLMSDPMVARDYTAEYEGDNPRDKLLGNRVTVKPEIISIVLREGGDNIKLATVRLRLITQNLETKAETMKIIVITLSYEYELNRNIIEAFRMDNPFGFIVTSYRKDDEV